MTSASTSSNNWNTMFYRKLGCPSSGCPAVQNMLYDMHFYAVSLNNVQQFEFDPDLYDGGYDHHGSIACRFVGSNAGYWHLWNSSVRTWEATTYPCTSGTFNVTAGQWHHIQLYVTYNTTAHTYTFQTFVYDENTVFHNLGTQYNAELCPNNGCPDGNVVVEQQIDNQAAPSTVNVYYDQYNLWVW